MPDFCRGRTRKQKITPSPGIKRLAQTRAYILCLPGRRPKKKKNEERFSASPSTKKKKANTATACLQKESKHAQADKMAIFIIPYSLSNSLVLRNTI